VRGEPRYLGKIKISKEYLFFVDDRVVEIKVIPGDSLVSFHLDDLYGQPDRPLGGFEDRSALGAIDYTDGRESTTVDDRGASHSLYFRWTRPTFTVTYMYSSYTGFGDETGSSGDEIIFRSNASIPPATDPALQLNSEAAKSSPAAAAELASTGHIATLEELADMVQRGLASKCAVITEPPGAEVAVDGKRAGVSPLAFVLMRHGDTPRTITIHLSGYKVLEKEVIPDGHAIPLGVTLEKE
jgi:hypothetical protein